MLLSGNWLRLTGRIDACGGPHGSIRRREETQVECSISKDSLPLTDTPIRRGTACPSVCANPLNSFESQGYWHGSCATGFKTEE
jgi:hypothetical protein